ncbi:hypothetical protein B296_00018806 [Ensete ventricosum]|uniref:Uncharacterized protein n=1 Tax=Ensete ventricosum TaxID=4639 RepID=A0A426YRP3_ENSVE|nr:hypothetical protein B296_00018806 [Ensete ventricosum]
MTCRRAGRRAFGDGDEVRRRVTFRSKKSILCFRTNRTGFFRRKKRKRKEKEGKTRMTTKEEMKPTVSIAVAGSIIDNAQSLELATLVRCS